MGTSNDDMIEQLRRRKVPYDNELNDSINYAIACIKRHNSLETEAIKYRKIQAEFEERLGVGMIGMLVELKTEFEKEKQDTTHLHYDDLDRAENYNNGIDNCIDAIQARIDKLKEKGEMT